MNVIDKINEKQIRKEFKTLVANFAYLKMAYFAANQDFKEISMGMTDDYQIAMSEGSTIVRVGSGIFGERGQDRNAKNNLNVYIRNRV